MEAPFARAPATDSFTKRFPCECRAQDPVVEIQLSEANGFRRAFVNPIHFFIQDTGCLSVVSTFLNSNVNALKLALQVKPSPQDTFTLRYAHIRANELNGPVQFGQATRVDGAGNLVTGVTDADLADDVFLEYSRIINRNTYITAGVSVSFPGAGIDNVIGEDASPWTGGFINVVVNF